jgi:hypothetical protein
MTIGYLTLLLTLLTNRVRSKRRNLCKSRFYTIDGIFRAERKFSLLFLISSTREITRQRTNCSPRAKFRLMKPALYRNGGIFYTARSTPDFRYFKSVIRATKFLQTDLISSHLGRNFMHVDFCMNALLINIRCNQPCKLR